MTLNGLNIGFGITGSFCTHSKILSELENIVINGANVYPIISYSVDQTDTRFGTAKDLKEKVEYITGHKIINSMVEAEPIGPKALFDILVVAPCTGSTLSRIAAGLSDTPVTLACKAHLRNNKPVVLSLSTNDGLGANAKNIATVLNTKNIYVVPFFQDDPHGKPNSITSRPDLIIATIISAMNGKQLQPVLCGSG
jgi:dipicolinate synthase subunit B